MPIAPELRKFYRTPEWFEARRLCLDRAAGKCEWCKKPRGDVRQALDHSGRWFDEVTREWIRPPAFRVGVDLSSFAMAPPRRASTVRCVIAPAHLDHNPENNAADNLAALCQRCHLVYDGPHHRASARLRRDRETGQLRLELSI